jgi:penicillin-binding protein 2
LTRKTESGTLLVPVAPRILFFLSSAPTGSMRHHLSAFFRLFTPVLIFALASSMAFAVTTSTTAKHHKKKKAVAAKSTEAANTLVVKPVAAKPLAAKPLGVRPLVATTAKSASRKKVWVQTWDEPTYKDSTASDRVDGEDLGVRKAAVAALGPLNGSVVVVDPTTGRILTMVNQPLTLGGGFQPCSTIKVSVALAALREGLVDKTGPAHFFSKRASASDLTDALAFSNNYYFANLGVKLGYERVNYYAHLFGYGEKAGLNVEGEHPGFFPEAPPKNGGMGMLTSFGEEISQTPLELAALMSAVANGGTLYWLQYPRSQEEVTDFQPQVKRHLDITGLIDIIKPGMRGAVDFGTARRAKQDDEILGKTGTCSEGRTHLGWFGSFNEAGRKLVVVVMLTGGRPSIGATASGVAGDVYRTLASENFFKTSIPLTPASLLTPQICCTR